MRSPSGPGGRFTEMLLQKGESLIFAAVAGPTPWNLATGNDAMKSGPIAGVMTNCPFGLRWLDASLARSLL